MPNEDQNKTEVRFTPEFRRNLRQLSKKFRRIRSDIQPVVEQLRSGEIIGEQVPRVGYRVYKVRVRNQDLRKGKRAGYRLLYYVRTPERVFLLTIYAKSEQGDVSAERIRQIIRNSQAQ